MSAFFDPRLEREAGRNVEMTGRLVSDHKTIAHFRQIEIAARDHQKIDVMGLFFSVTATTLIFIFEMGGSR